MQRWEYLKILWSDKWVRLEFTHRQPDDEYAYPLNPKDSNPTRVVIDTNSREFKQWTGPWWFTQIADYGWELVSGAYNPGSAGSWHNDYHMFFRRPRPS
jgi:hypothetical protein